MDLKFIKKENENKYEVCVRKKDLYIEVWKSLKIKSFQKEGILVIKDKLPQRLIILDSSKFKHNHDEDHCIDVYILFHTHFDFKIVCNFNNENIRVGLEDRYCLYKYIDITRSENEITIPSINFHNQIMFRMKLFIFVPKKDLDKDRIDEDLKVYSSGCLFPDPHQIACCGYSYIDIKIKDDEQVEESHSQKY